MTKLSRELKLWQITLIGVGIILGAGIYVLIGEAAGLAGNAVWISFILAAIVSAFTGLSYAELSSMFPKAGAEYVYVNKSLGRELAWLVGWLIILGGLISSACVSIGFANYFSALFHTPITLTALTLIMVCGIILFVGVKQSAFFTIVFTLIETTGLIIIIFIGLPMFGVVNYLEMSASGLAGLNGIFEASALIFFAFIGFETITRLSEETKNPTKTMPKALILSIFITTIIYIFVAVSAISVLDWSNLSKSKAPLADVASSVFGPNAYLIISVIALFATFNTVLAIMLGTSRLIYGMATQNIGKFHGLAWFLCSIYEKTKTPWASIMLTTLLSMPFVLTGNIKTVANMTNFTVFVTFILVNASVIWFRYKKPNIKRGFKTPINIGKLPLLPVLGIITCLFMLLNIGFDVLIYGFIIMLVGFAVYWITNKRIEK